MKTPYLVLALFVAVLPPLCADDAANAAVARLNRIIVPIIVFEKNSVQEALDFLWARSVELDNEELDPARKGMSSVEKVPVGTGAEYKTSDGFFRWPEQGFTISYEAKNVPLLTALAEVAKQGHVDCYLTDVGVVICQPGDAPFPNIKADKGKVWKAICRTGRTAKGSAKGEHADGNRSKAKPSSPKPNQ